jgi:hypothetical protein
MTIQKIDRNLKTRVRVEQAVQTFAPRQQFTTREVALILGETCLPNVRHHLTQLWGQRKLGRTERGGGVLWTRKASK